MFHGTQDCVHIESCEMNRAEHAEATSALWPFPTDIRLFPLIIPPAGPIATGNGGQRGVPRAVWVAASTDASIRFEVRITRNNASSRARGGPDPLAGGGWVSNPPSLA